MTIFHDMLCKPTPGEEALRKKVDMAQAHAESLEERLMVHDPREAIDQAIHSKVCFERQVAAHAWRRANTLQSQLNGAENRRYSRGLAGWMAIGFGSQMVLKGGLTWETAAAIIKFFGGL